MHRWKRAVDRLKRADRRAAWQMLIALEMLFLDDDMGVVDFSVDRKGRRPYV